MANNTVSQIEINGTTYDLLDANTLETVSTLKQKVTDLESSMVKKLDAAEVQSGYNESQDHLFLDVFTTSQDKLTLVADFSLHALRMLKNNNEIDMRWYSSFNEIPIIDMAIPYSCVVLYNGVDYNAPLKQSDAWWWNVIQFGTSTRLTRIASCPYRYHNGESNLFINQKHDSEWNGWSDLNGVRCDTLSSSIHVDNINASGIYPISNGQVPQGIPWTDAINGFLEVQNLQPIETIVQRVYRLQGGISQKWSRRRWNGSWSGWVTF